MRQPELEWKKQRNCRLTCYEHWEEQGYGKWEMGNGAQIRYRQEIYHEENTVGWLVGHKKEGNFRWLRHSHLSERTPTFNYLRQEAAIEEPNSARSQQQ